MATYYVDPAATGANNGTSWTDAYTSLQSAVSACVGAGNTIFAKGTQLLNSGGTATIDFSTAASGELGNYNKIIGCNASGVNDGTYFTVDGNNSNGASIPGIFWKTSSFWWIENIHATRCQGSGFGGSLAYANSWIVNNCKATLNAAHGFTANASSSDRRILYRCVAHNNLGSGFYNNRSSFSLFCRSVNNSVAGFYGFDESLYGCIAANNGQQGIYLYGGDAIHCISDDNGSTISHYGYYLAYGRSTLLGCRATNNFGYGIVGSSTQFGIALFNFINGNGAGGIQSTIGLLEFTENITSGTDGYVDRANGDYNLTADATLRRVPITLPE